MGDDTSGTRVNERIGLWSAIEFLPCRMMSNQKPT